MAKKGKNGKDKQGDPVKFGNPVHSTSVDANGGMKLGDTKKKKKQGKKSKMTSSGDSDNSDGLLPQDFLTLSFDAEASNGGRKGGKNGNGKKSKKKGGETVDDFMSGIAAAPEPEPEPVKRMISQDQIDKWKKKSVQNLQKKALKSGASESAVLDCGNSKNKLIDLIVHGEVEDSQSWAQKATAKRDKDKNESMFKMKSSVNMDFHGFESSAPDAAEHFLKIEEGEAVKVVDYWLDDPEENYVPCTNNDGGLNADCIWYSLSCPCLWRVAWDGLPTWENPEPDPDDLQQMLVYDDVNSKRIYILAPRPNESLHSTQCRNACLYQKLHHPVISIVTTHQFNELSKFEKIMVFVLGFFLACFLTEGMEKALGLELEEFIGIPAIATFLFFKLFTAIASIPADTLVLGFPIGKVMDATLPLAIRAAFIIFVVSMAYYGALEQKLVIVNLCQFTMVFHDTCDFEVHEILVSAIIDLLKGVAFEFLFGFTLVFRPRFLRFELFGFCPPSIPGEIYQAHHKTEIVNERGNKDYLSAWKKPWGYGDKGRALVNWMEIRPETQKVAERQKELYIKSAEYAKEQDLKKSQALAKEVEALMSIEEVDRSLKREDMRRANTMHEATKMNALELLKTTLDNINVELEADVRAAEAIVPDTKADIKAEIKAVRRHANTRANEAGPGFFDRSIFFRGEGRKKKLAAVKAIRVLGDRDEAAADIEMMEAEGVRRVKVATSKATAARIAADDKWLKDTHDAHKRLKAMEDEAYEVYEDHISAAEEASHKRTKKQQAKADKAEAQADAAAAEMEAKRQREAALDRNKDRLREENRELLTNRLEQLLEAEAQMALERTRDQWLSALVDAGQKHLAAKAGAGTWKHVQPPTNLYLEADYERRHIAELHQKLDDAMVSLAEAYKQRDGAKRHKQVMIQIATPKHRPKRRQKQLRKAADARIEAATREGDATISKMQENVLTWKAVVLTGLEKMAAEQDEMMKVAEQELERVQEAAKETAQVIMGFGGKLSDIIESDQFQEPEKIRAEKRREMERLAAEEAASLSKKQKKKKKKKQVDEEEEEEEEEDVVSLTEPFIKKLRGTEALRAMVEKEKARDKVEARKAAAEAAEEARRLALSQLVVKATEEQKRERSPKAGGSQSPDKPPKDGKSPSKKGGKSSSKKGGKD